MSMFFFILKYQYVFTDTIYICLYALHYVITLSSFNSRTINEHHTSAPSRKTAEMKLYDNTLLI